MCTAGRCGAARRESPAPTTKAPPLANPCKPDAEGCAGRSVFQLCRFLADDVEKIVDETACALTALLADARPIASSFPNLR